MCFTGLLFNFVRVDTVTFVLNSVRVRQPVRATKVVAKEVINRSDDIGHHWTGGIINPPSFTEFRIVMNEERFIEMLRRILSGCRLSEFSQYRSYVSDS